MFKKQKLKNTNIIYFDLKFRYKYKIQNLPGYIREGKSLKNK